MRGEQDKTFPLGEFIDQWDRHLKTDYSILITTQYSWPSISVGSKSMDSINIR